MSSVGRYLILPCSFAATIGKAAQPPAPVPVASSSIVHGGAASPSASFPFVLCIYSAHPVLVKRRPAYVPALTMAIHLATIVADTKKLSEVSHCGSTHRCGSGAARHAYILPPIALL